MSLITGFIHKTKPNLNKHSHYISQHRLIHNPQIAFRMLILFCVSQHRSNCEQILLSVKKLRAPYLF